MVQELPSSTKVLTSAWQLRQFTNDDALQTYPDSWYRAPHLGQARREPSMVLLQPQQTTPEAGLGALTAVAFDANAVGGGGDFAGVALPSLRRTMSKPATTSPTMMKMSKPITATVVPTPPPELRVGSAATSMVAA